MFNEDKIANTQKPAEQNSEKIESKESGYEYLEVEPGRLMHSGNFYLALNEASHKNSNRSGFGNPHHAPELYLGRSPSHHPELNTSIYSYIHRNSGASDIYGGPKNRTSTAVYGKYFARGIKVGDFTSIDGNHSRVMVVEEYERLKNDRAYDQFTDEHLRVIAKDNIQERLDRKYLSSNELEALSQFNREADDLGIPVSPEQVFDPSAIEALICYSSKDVQDIQELIATRPHLAHIKIYLEKITPELLGATQEKLITKLDQRIKEIFDRFKKNYEEQIEFLQSKVQKAESVKVNVLEIIAETYDCIRRGELVTEKLSSLESQRTKWSKSKNNWVALNTEQYKQNNNDYLLPNEAPVEFIRELNAEWLASELNRDGRSAFVDEFQGSILESREKLQTIILNLGEIPLGSELAKNKFELENLTNEKDSKLKALNDDLINMRAEYVQKITEANHHNINEVVDKINQDIITFVDQNIFLRSSNYMEIMKDGEPIYSDRHYITPPNKLWWRRKWPKKEDQQQNHFLYERVQEVDKN